MSKVNQEVRRLSCSVPQLVASSVVLVVGVILAGVAIFQRPAAGLATAQDLPAARDPAAWGSDHVGQAIPEFVSGDECLFCHRDDIAVTWSQNRHATTIRPAATASAALGALRQSLEGARLAEEVQFIVGRSNRIRFLKRLPQYGRMAILSAGWVPPSGDEPGRLVDADASHWQDETFGDSCAGCHATGVDTATSSFFALSLECYVCHGDASLDHTNDSSLIHLAEKRNDEPRIVISICAQCHVRTGKSRSTGRPYANNFVAGDNLFRDFQVDISNQHLSQLGHLDRHVLENVRDVVVFGQSKVTCLSCHQVHTMSNEKHRRLVPGQICLNCHYADQPKSELKPYKVNSQVCGY